MTVRPDVQRSVEVVFLSEEEILKKKVKDTNGGGRFEEDESTGSGNGVGCVENVDYNDFVTDNDEFCVYKVV